MRIPTDKAPKKRRRDEQASQDVYGMEDIVNGERQGVHVARTSADADEWLAMSSRVLDVATTLNL